MGIDPSIIDLHYRFAHHCAYILIRICVSGSGFESSADVNYPGCVVRYGNKDKKVIKKSKNSRN